MRTLLLLIVLVLVLHLGLRLVARQFNEDVQARFIERIEFIPSMRDHQLTTDNGALTAGNLTLWIGDPENDVSRRGYISPVIVPLDLLFLLSLGSLLGWASMYLAGSTKWSLTWPWYIWWIVPAGYMISDLVEDGLIVGLLLSPALVTPDSFRLLACFTASKLLFVKAGLVQVGVLLLAWAASRTLIFS